MNMNTRNEKEELKFELEKVALIWWSTSS